MHCVFVTPQYNKGNCRINYMSFLWFNFIHIKVFLFISLYAININYWNLKVRMLKDSNIDLRIEDEICFDLIRYK